MKKIGWNTALTLVFTLVIIIGCQRSPAFKRDADVTPSDSSGSYYNRGAGGKRTQRLESLGQPKKRVLVLGFWNDTPVRQDDAGPFAAEELKRGLAMTGRMIIPPDLHSTHDTQDFIDASQGSKVRVAQLIREGRKMSVSVLVIGRIAKIVFRQKGDDVGLLRQKQSLAAVELEIKLFDVSSGREIMASSKSGQASSSALVALDATNVESPEFRSELTRLALREASGLLVPDVIKAIEKLTWEGRIAKVAGNKIYVNAGRASGLVAGDILKVLSPGDDVYDPATGAYLGRSQGQLKGTLEVTDFLGTDGAVTEIHTGAAFQEGDIVQLY